MARLLGPAPDSWAYVLTGGTFRSAGGLTAVVYSDATGSTLADIAAYDGSNTPGVMIAGSTVTIDSNSLLPLFWFPDGATTVYISVNGGPRTPAYANYSPRIDTLNAGKVDKDALAVNVQDHGVTTAAADQSAAFATLLATASTGNPLTVYFPPGTYRFDSPWPAINAEAVRIVGSGAFHTILDFTRLTSGPAIAVQKTSGDNRKHVVLADLDMRGPATPGTTVDALSLGGATTYANQCVFERVRVTDFRDQIVLGDNTWAVDFTSCAFRNAGRYGVNASGAVTNSGEGIRFIGGTIFGAVTDCIYVNNSTGVDCLGVSLDYANHLVTVGGGGRVTLTNCWLEVGDAQTGTDMIQLVKGNAFNSHLALRGCTFWASYTTGGHVTAFARITGDATGTNDNSVLTLDGLEIADSASQTGINVLVKDDSTASAASNAAGQSHIVINGVSYRDAGGPVGGGSSYYPWLVIDRAGRKHMIAPGVSYGDILYDYPHRQSSWSTPTIHLHETMPHVIATDTLQPASGVLYVARLSTNGGLGFDASAWRLYTAIDTAGVSMTRAEIGIYDLGPDSGAQTTLTKVASTPGANFTGGNTVVFGSFASALNTGYLRSQLFAAILFVGGTSPAVYGKKTAAASPLMDPAQTAWTWHVGKLSGQSALPSTIAVSSLTKSEFLPWIAIKPTAY